MCGHWRPFVFEWRGGSSGVAGRNVWVATSFDAWHAEELVRRPSDGVYHLPRMVPQEEFLFVYEVRVVRPLEVVRMLLWDGSPLALLWARPLRDRHCAQVDGVVRAANDELHTRVVGDNSTASAGAGRRMSSLARGSFLDSEMAQVGEDGFIQAHGAYVNVLWDAERELHRTEKVRTLRAQQARETALRWLDTIKRSKAKELEIKRRREEEEQARVALAYGQADGSAAPDDETKGGGTASTAVQQQHEEGTPQADQRRPRGEAEAVPRPGRARNLKAVFRRGVGKAVKLIREQGAMLGCSQQWMCVPWHVVLQLLIQDSPLQLLWRTAPRLKPLTWLLAPCLQRWCNVWSNKRSPRRGALTTHVAVPSGRMTVSAAVALMWTGSTRRSAASSKMQQNEQRWHLSYGGFTVRSG